MIIISILEPTKQFIKHFMTQHHCFASSLKWSKASFFSAKIFFFSDLKQAETAFFSVETRHFFSCQTQQCLIVSIWHWLFIASTLGMDNVNINNFRILNMFVVVRNKLGILELVYVRQQSVPLVPFQIFFVWTYSHTFSTFYQNVCWAKSYLTTRSFIFKI